MDFSTGNVVRGKLANGSTYAMVSRQDLDAKAKRMTEQAGRHLNPGELMGASARQLEVNRILGVRTPEGVKLETLLEPTGPGKVKALRELPPSVREDLAMTGLTVE